MKPPLRALAPSADRMVDLTPVERLTVLALRGWVGAIKRGEGEPNDLPELFAQLGAADAAPALAGLLRLTSATAMRQVDVRCVGCPHLSPDEARVLMAVAGLQRRELEPAFEALSAWLPPRAITIGLDMARDIALALDRAGQALPMRRWDFEDWEDEVGDAASGRAPGRAPGRAAPTRH